MLSCIFSFACSSYFFLEGLTVFPARLFEEKERLNIVNKRYVFDSNSYENVGGALNDQKERYELVKKKE